MFSDFSFGLVGSPIDDNWMCFSFKAPFIQLYLIYLKNVKSYSIRRSYSVGIILPYLNSHCLLYGQLFKFIIAIFISYENNLFLQNDKSIFMSKLSSWVNGTKQHLTRIITVGQIKKKCWSSLIGDYSLHILCFLIRTD